MSAATALALSVRRHCSGSVCRHLNMNLATSSLLDSYLVEFIDQSGQFLNISF